MSDRSESPPAADAASSSWMPSILVVDDNPLVTRALSQILRQAGYRPLACYRGDEALERLANEQPVAAVVDIHLPDTSGLTLSRTLRQRLGPDRPIIILSGDTSIDNLRSLADVGATYFIGKPFNPEQLLQTLRELVST